MIDFDSSLVNIGDSLILIDSMYFRPTEVDMLIGDCSKAKKQLKWKKEYNFKMMVDEMVLSDIENVKLELLKVKK